jgi:glycerol kinase
MLKQESRTMTAPDAASRCRKRSRGRKTHGPTLILALDQGTTSTRAILFEAAGKPLADASRPLRQSYPRDGWVEHDADEIYAACVGGAARRCREGRPRQRRHRRHRHHQPARDGGDLGQGHRPADPSGHRLAGPPHRRGLRALREAKATNRAVTAATGLLLDPYFSGTKIAWILDKVPGARARAEAASCWCGTMDCWVIWRLTGGRVHATDATNASRTLLFDIRRPGLVGRDAGPVQRAGALLPEVLDCAGRLRRRPTAHPGPRRADPRRGRRPAGGADGAGLRAPGQMKATYGTGCFMLVNTGEDRAASPRAC